MEINMNSNQELSTSYTEQHVIRIQELMQITGVSRSSIWRWVKSGDLPPPIALGPNCIGWLSAEIYKWLEDRPRVK